jgi:hypothetical protein
MASIVLSAAGSAAGSYLGPLGSLAGRAVGSFVGQQVDNRLFSSSRRVSSSRGRLTELAVQTSTYGKMIPVVYGSSRIAGNIIWALPIKETATTQRSSAGGGKGGGSPRVSQSQTSYSYSVTLAIAICEGPIDAVLRVWADAKVVSPDEAGYTLYWGDETQLPDPLIESYEGVGATPAYRGLAYVVIEDFPLADYGNRIPNFTFEVKRRMLARDSETPVEELISSMVMIPGSGEFVYDTIVQNKVPGVEVGGNWVQQGEQLRINQNNQAGKADALLSLDQLQETCPNVAWVAPVVTWFGTSTDAGSCVIRPGVEYQSGITTTPDVWAVGGVDRAGAYLISQDDDGNPNYGGTISDASLLRYLDELKDRGLKIMFYPLFFMDVEGKPWRGRLTGSVSDVADFFTKTNGYNAFILHYAALVASRVDAFVIGSELIGLTSVKDGSNNFPAVSALVSLAANVKAIVGSGVKVTYAADWSEYHHTTGGWYNLDPLWASANIDVVGIDAYFPLTDSVQDGYDEQAVMDGWTSGEGYDWVYTDEERTVQASIEAKYAWKNMGWWWNNSHVNPDGNATAWVPGSKKIWFTEYGFPSVDGATNQPNVFYDPSSSESYFPRFSRGRVDFRAQRLGITATEKKWAGSSMVQRKFLWTWDARPYPYYPDLTDIWRDGAVWKTGHWVSGKLGISNLGAVVEELAVRSGLDTSDCDVGQLTDLVDGFVIADALPLRSAIETLQAAYFFDAVESGELLAFVKRGGSNAVTIEENDLVAEEGKVFSIMRVQEGELPRKIDVNFINKVADYQTGNQHAERQATLSLAAGSLSLPIVLSEQAAKNIADVTLYNAWTERNVYSFSLPVKYAVLEPADVVTVNTSVASHHIRIISAQLGANNVLQVRGVAEDSSAYDFYNTPGAVLTATHVMQPVGATEMLFLDLPAFPGDGQVQGSLRLAAHGQETGWRGAVLYRSDDGGVSYNATEDIIDNAIIGTAVTVLASGATDIFDRACSVTVVLMGGELESVTELAVLNGANLAKIGDELLQFTTATLLEPYKYSLSGLLRGRLGTEHAVASHVVGEKFVLIDSRVHKITPQNNIIGLSRSYKPVSIGHTLGQTSAVDFIYRANSLKPYSPVHITGSRDGSDNLTINWVRRTRISGGWQDNSDVPLGEESEAYEVEVLDGADVIRTLSGITTPSAIYTLAQQVADFGGAQTEVTVRIYQISAIVGRGTPGNAVI